MPASPWIIIEGRETFAKQQNMMEFHFSKNILLQTGRFIGTYPRITKKGNLFNFLRSICRTKLQQAILEWMGKLKVKLTEISGTTSLTGGLVQLSWMQVNAIENILQPDISGFASQRSGREKRFLVRSCFQNVEQRISYLTPCRSDIDTHSQKLRNNIEP